MSFASEHGCVESIDWNKNWSQMWLCKRYAIEHTPSRPKINAILVMYMDNHLSIYIPRIAFFLGQGTDCQLHSSAPFMIVLLNHKIHSMLVRLKMLVSDFFRVQVNVQNVICL